MVRLKRRTGRGRSERWLAVQAGAVARRTDDVRGERGWPRGRLLDDDRAEVCRDSSPALRKDVRGGVDGTGPKRPHARRRRPGAALDYLKGRSHTSVGVFRDEIMPFDLDEIDRHAL